MDRWLLADMVCKLLLQVDPGKTRFHIFFAASRWCHRGSLTSGSEARIKRNSEVDCANAGPSEIRDFASQKLLSEACSLCGMLNSQMLLVRSHSRAQVLKKAPAVINEVFNLYQYDLATGPTLHSMWFHIQNL
jgi:hypothetical protein